MLTIAVEAEKRRSAQTSLSWPSPLWSQSRDIETRVELIRMSCFHGCGIPLLSRLAVAGSLPSAKFQDFHAGIYLEHCTLIAATNV